MPDELRPHIRHEDSPGDEVVVVRGGTDSVDKLKRHAARTNRAFQLDGKPFYGVSAFLALDLHGVASLDGILAGRMVSYAVVHLPTVGHIHDAGFDLLPTFHRPHFTLVLPDVSATTVEALGAALGPPMANPYHVLRRRS